MQTRTRFCLLLLCFPGVIYAQLNPFPVGDQDTEPLTAAVVQKVLAAYKDLTDEFKDYQADGAEGIGAFLQAQQASSKAHSIIGKHGFTDAADWYARFIQVMRAYSARKLQASQKQMPQMDEQIRQIEKNPNLTAEQKQAAIEMMKASQGMMQSMMSSSAADIKAVEPYMQEFERLFDEN